MIRADRPPAAADRLLRVLRGRLVPDVLVMCGFLVLTVALTYPIVWRFADTLPGYPPVDNFHYLWELWYPAHAIFDLHTSPFVDPNIYSPFGFDLIRNQDMSPATVLLFAPLTRAVGEVVAYNLIVLCRSLTAFGTYLLSRELWGVDWRRWSQARRSASAFIVSHSGPSSLVNTQWIPFSFSTRADHQTANHREWIAGRTLLLIERVGHLLCRGCAIAAILYAGAADVE